MVSVAAERLAMWQLVIIALSVSIGVVSSLSLGANLPPGPVYKPPAIKLDFMQDGKFDDSLVKNLHSEIGNSALQHMMEHTIRILRVSCDTGSFSEIAFCLCMPSMPESSCEKMDANGVLRNIIKSDCPGVFEIAAKKKDNCIASKVSSYLNDLPKETFTAVWKGLEKYQDSLMSRIGLTQLQLNATELVNFVSDTDPEARCDSNVIGMVKTNMKKMHDLPNTLLPFANRTQLRDKINKSSKDQKKDMLREIRKHKETCTKGKMSDVMGNRPDMKEIELRKPDVTTIITCDAMNATGQWTLQTADDVADKMICSPYDDPDTLDKVCGALTSLSADTIAKTLEEKPQICLLEDKCKKISKPIPQNNQTMKCLPVDEMRETVSSTKDLASLQKVAKVACQSTGMRREQMEVLAEAMSAHLDAVTEDQASEAICVMKHIPVTNLTKASFLSTYDKKKSFCQLMATSDQSTVNASEVNEMSAFCKEAGVPLPEQDELLRNVMPEDIEDLTVDNVIASPQMTHFMCRLDTLQALADKLKESFGDDLNSMDQDALSAMLPVLLGMEEPTGCPDIYINNYGELLTVLRRISDTCTGEIVEAAMDRYEVIVDLCEDAESSPARRKKRSNPSNNEPSCADLTGNVDLVDRSADYLGSLSCSVFSSESDCLNELATVDGYSYDQLQALGRKLTSCNAGQLTSLVPQLCVLLLGIPVQSLSEISFAGDNIQCAGQQKNTKMTSTELTPYFIKYLMDNQIEVKTLAKDQIGEIGFIICGIPSDKIPEFPLYREMSSTVNIYGCFDQDQLEAWAGLEIKTFGNTIDPASLGRIFFVVAGFSPDVYESFTPEHIKQIPDIVFSKIPSSNLEKLSQNAICAISKEQANYISSDGLSNLPDAMKNIINSIKVDQLPEACQPSSNIPSSNDKTNGTKNNNGNDTTPNSKHNDTTPNSKGDDTTPNSKGNDTTPNSKGNDTTPNSKGNDNTPNSKHNDTTPNSKGNDTTPNSKHNDTTPNSKGNDTTPNNNNNNIPQNSNNNDNPKNSNNNDMPGKNNDNDDTKNSNGNDDTPTPHLKLDDIAEYQPPSSSYDFRHSAESLANMTAENLASVDLKRMPTSSIKELDDESILNVAEQICDSSDHDKKAFIKTKIESMFSKLSDQQKKSVMGCVPANDLKSVTINELLPLMKDGKFTTNTPQAQIMAEKTTDALRNSLAGNTSPTVEELLTSAGSVICLLPTGLFKKAVGAVQDKPDLLKSLMLTYKTDCGSRDPARAKVLADAIGKNVDLKNKTVDELKTELKTNKEQTCSASDDLKELKDDLDLLQTAMANCNGTREELAARATTSYKNLQKYFTKIDTVSTAWQNKLRKLDWKNVNVSQGGILDYFIPLLRSDYENITKQRVCASEKLPDVLGYPQVSLGAMLYQFCKDIHKTNFAKFKQLGIHAPVSEIKQNAKAQDVLNLKKAIYMVPKSKFDALSDVSNKAFNPSDSTTFSKAQYTLIGLDMKSMNETKEEDRGILCDMMACNAITALSPEDIEEKLTFCKQYLSWENFLCAHSPSIKEQFMIPASGLSTNTIKKLNITCQDVNDNLVGLAATVTSCDTRQWLYKCSKQNGRRFNDTADLEIYSQLIDQMPDDDFSQISDEKKCSMWEDVIREETKRRTDLIDFRLNMNSLIDHTSCYGVNNSVTKQRIGAMKQSCAKLNRKKRAASGMTCNEFLSYGNNREYLVSAQDISSMSEEDFKDCVVDIGTTAGFTTDHWVAAAALAKKVFGNVTSWTSETLQNLGGITSGLTVDELTQLDLSDLDAASVVGTSGTWDNDKLTTAYAEFKKDLLKNDAKNTNSTHLTSIGELNCGATNEDIRNIDPKVYCDAADKIGSLQNCEPIQKQAYAQLAKDPACFGNDVASWSPDVIRVLGVQIGGLEQDDIAALKADQLLEIDRLAMQQIPPNVINAFSIEQLEMFDPDQVSALTTDQMASLDPEKRTLVEKKAETTNDSSDEENDAALSEASLLLLFTMLMASLLRI